MEARKRDETATSRKGELRETAIGSTADREKDSETPKEKTSVVRERDPLKDELALVVDKPGGKEVAPVAVSVGHSATISDKESVG